MKIFDILPVGEENAISAKALSAKLGLSVRECRARISKELQEGSFCLSSTHRPGGYFRPSPGEKRASRTFALLPSRTFAQPFECSKTENSPHSS